MSGREMAEFEHDMDVFVTAYENLARNPGLDGEKAVETAMATVNEERREERKERKGI